MADPLREKLKALVDQWGAEAMKERMESPSWAEYSPDDLAEVQEQCARQLSALLAESEPNPGKTHYQGDDCPGGHASVCGYCGAPCGWCSGELAGQPRYGCELHRYARPDCPECAECPQPKPVLKLGH